MKKQLILWIVSIANLISVAALGESRKERGEHSYKQRQLLQQEIVKYDPDTGKTSYFGGSQKTKDYQKMQSLVEFDSRIKSHNSLRSQTQKLLGKKLVK